MSKKIKEFLEIRALHCLRPIKEEGNLRLEVEEVELDRGIRTEAQYGARFRIGATCFVPRGGDGDLTSWEIALRILQETLHCELFSEVQPLVGEFAREISYLKDLDYESRKKLLNLVDKLDEVVRYRA
jgi:hypothetical protein